MNYKAKMGASACEDFGRAAMPGYSPLTGLAEGETRVPLAEKITTHYTRGKILADAMSARGLEPENLLHRAKVLAGQDPDFKIPLRFRSVEIGRWFASGERATAPRDLFECAWNVTQRTAAPTFEPLPPARGGFKFQ